MAKHDDIHSTEKLLNLIRQNKTPEETHESQLASPAPSAKKSKGTAPVSFKKRITIGVDIGHTYIRLAKISQSDKSPEILDYLHVPLKTKSSVGDPKIQTILKNTLDQFCESSSRSEIWGAIQSANVETRSIRIPKVPRKQVANAVFWTFTKKVSYNEDEEVLDYEIIGDVIEGAVKKIEVMAFKAPRAEIEQIKSAFQAIGYPLNGITIVPFAIQNLFRSGAIEYSGQDSCCLFVGRDWSRIAIFNNGNLVLSRGIKAGMRSMVEAINISIQKRDEISTPSPRDSSDPNSSNELVSDAINPIAQKLFFKFIGIDNPMEGNHGDNAYSEYGSSKIFKMILPAMNRLVRQVERTFEHYTLNFKDRAVQRIYISGQITANKLAMKHIGTQLDLPIEAMNPFPANSPFTRLISVPQSASDRESFVPSIGLALANNSITPNFLFTHRDRNEIEIVRQNNMRILTGCMIVLLVLIGIFSWQERRLENKRFQLDELNNTLFTFNPPAEKEMLLSLYAKTKSKRQILQHIVQRYSPAAVVTELAHITPPNIRLINIAAVFSQIKSKDNSTPMNTLSVDGVVFGNSAVFESDLTEYLLKLKSSPLFDKPNIQNKNIEYYQDQEVLRFKARLNVI